MGDVVGFAPASGGHGVAHAFDHLRLADAERIGALGHHLAVEVRINRSGGDGVDADSVGRHFEGERAGEADDAGL